MIFSVVVILFFAAIAYFYYAQGFLTSLLSAVCAVMAAVVAISYHENLEFYAFANRMTDVGAAFSLAVIFAVVFVSTRLILDSAIPGNIRLPVLVDRIGAGVCGVICAIFATGVFAIAAQALPFGPGIMGQSRFKIASARDVHVPTAGQAADEQVLDQLSSETLKDEDRVSLWLPVDEWVLGFVSYLSDGGSLAGDRTLASVHPNYLDELFAQRIGIQAGGAHVAVNSPNHETVKVPLAYVAPALAEADGEIPQLRNGTLSTIKPKLEPDGKNVILVLRVIFTQNAADDDKLVRFGMASFRLLANGINYTPLGTLDDAGVLRVNMPDDPVFVGVGDGEHGADVVFYVPKSDVLQGGTVTRTSSGQVLAETFGSFAPGVFLEVKRMALIDLSPVKLVPPMAPDKTLNVLRKKNLPPAKVTVALPTELGDDSPFVFDHLVTAPQLFTPIAIGPYDGDNTTVNFASGSALVSAKQFAKLTLNPTTPLAELPRGDNAIDALVVPPGMKLVQLVGTLPPKSNDPWLWAEHLGDLALVDASGKSYVPSGAIAKGMKSIQPMALGAYDSSAPVPSIPKAQDVRPTDVWLLYLVPASATLKELDYQGKRLTPINKSILE
jgi:hypothetical protein